jgi:hypothetical protein
MARRLQWLVLALAAVLWAAWPAPYFWTLLAAYGVAWLLAHFVGRSALDLNLPRPLLWTALGLLLLAPVTSAYRLRYEWVVEEGLRGLGPHFLDRVRLQAEPTLFPPVVFHDRPQTFYAYAPRAETLDLRLGGGGPSLPGIPLGEGLFRIELNPATGEGTGLTESRRLAVDLVADGRAHRRELLQVHPFAHPRWFDSAPEVGLAASSSEESDEVFVVTRAGLERTIPTGDGPTSVAFVDGGGSLAIAHRYEPYLWKVPLDSEAPPQKLELGSFQHRLAASAAGDRLAVASKGTTPRIDLVDSARFALVDSIEPGFPPDWIVFGRTADDLIVSCRETQTLHRLRFDATAGWQPLEPLRLGRPVVTMARATDGSAVYAAVTDYRPDGEPQTANHFIQDQILVVDLDRWEVTDRILTARRTRRQRSAGNVDSGAGPSGIVARADGSLLVAFAGSEEVWELPPDSHHPARVRRRSELDLITPHGIADLGEGYWAAASPAGGALVVYDDTGEIVEFVGVTPNDSELSAEPADSTYRFGLTLRAGERAFFEATRSGIACSSCHSHGDTDHVAHNIGQRPLLPTLTTLGVAGTTPYLRDASFPRIRDLNSHLAQGLYRGYPRHDSRRGESLEAFVESLPREINPLSLEGERDLEHERAGFEAFARARCALCHPPPAFTNLSKHPVRSLFPDYGADQLTTAQIDTPSLLGSHARSHFLQDGRADDLEGVLGRYNKANRHGDSSVLNDDERQALIDFLLSL